jgi:hypothetical protein
VAKTNYIARLNNEIVGTRSSERTYTHAVVIQYNEQHFHDRAHNYEASGTDRKNFEYETEVASGRSPYEWNKNDAAIDKAKAIIEGGFDAYIERLRQRQIAIFETSRANGGFTPAVVTWCGRADLAQKEAAKRMGQPSIENVWVVQAETVEKLPKIKGERKHAAYGPHSS